jgi:hypothetical protein
VKVKTTITLTEDDLRQAISDHIDKRIYEDRHNPTLIQKAGRITLRQGRQELVMEELQNQMDTQIVCEVEVDKL